MNNNERLIPIPMTLVAPANPAKILANKYLLFSNSKKDNKVRVRNNPSVYPACRKIADGKLVLVAFPVFLVFPLVLKSKRLILFISLLLFLLQLHFISFFINGYWVA